MAQTLSSAALEERRQRWIERVRGLIDQIATWAEANGWQVERHQKKVTEPGLGTYELPGLSVHLEGGELLANPIGLELAGGGVRVDLEALPTLSRVKLIDGAQGWRILTDSNVPLRVNWDSANFTQLAHDLLA